MAHQHGFETDKGLSRRMFMTGLAMVALYVVVFGILASLGISMVMIVIFEFAFLFGQYFFSDKIAMFSMQAREVTPEEAPQLHAMVDRLCALGDMPKPRVGIARSDVPNAFATGRNPKASVVCVTEGIMRRLDDEQLEAVLAHELSHVAHRDVAIMTIASSLGMLAGIISRMAMWGAMFSGGGNDRDNNGSNVFLLEIATFVISIAVYVVSFLLTMSLSRYRELAADRSGAILIGKPSVLASALVKISGDMAKIPNNDLRKTEGMNAFFFAPAFSKGSAASLLSTHPSLQQRLDQLARLEKEMNS
jgi:heat shock protein HtpX